MVAATSGDPVLRSRLCPWIRPIGMASRKLVVSPRHDDMARRLACVRADGVIKADDRKCRYVPAGTGLTTRQPDTGPIFGRARPVGGKGPPANVRSGHVSRVY